MQYFVLMLPILIGWVADDLWTGIVIGSLLYACVAAYKKNRTGGAVTPQRVQALEDELREVRRRLSVLEDENRRPSEQAAAVAALHEAVSAGRQDADVQTASSAVSPLPEYQAAPERAAEGKMPSEKAAEAFALETPAAEVDKIQAAAEGLPEAVPMPSETAAPQPHLSRIEKLQMQADGIYRPSENIRTKRSAAVPKAEAKPEPNPLLAWFMRGNPLLKTGIVVLFLGLAFLLRYASERVHIPVEMRYLSVAAAGLAATLGGWKLQSRKREYSLVLQGFGIAVMYLTALSALKLHPLLPAPAAFALMAALSAAMAVLAVRQNAHILAQVAVVGGMAAPVLVSDGNGNYVMLFSYLALLNTGVAAAAWFKAWRALNLTGFAGTFAIGALWGADAYTPQHFATTEPFLLYHWLLYTLVAYLFARRVLRALPEDTRPHIADNAPLAQIWHDIAAYGMRVHAIDHVLLFGTALAAFSLQYRMVSAWEYAAAWSALGFAAVYGAAALLLRRDTDLPALRQAFAALALMFFTLAVPLAFNQEKTAALWTLEAALVYGFGLRDKLPHSRFAALTVFLAAAAAQAGTYRAGGETLLAGSWFNTLLVIAGGGAVYGLWYKMRRDGSAQWERNLQSAVAATGMAYVSVLPCLWFGVLPNMLAQTALAAVWAYGGRRMEHQVFAAFAVICTLFGFTLAIDGHGPLAFADAALYGGAALAAAVAAFQFHRMPQDAWCGWQGKLEGIGYAALAAALGYAVYGIAGYWTAVRPQVSEYLVFAVALIPAFGLMMLAAGRLKWQQAQRAGLAFTPLFCAGLLPEIFDMQRLSAVFAVLPGGTLLHAWIVRSQKPATWLADVHTVGLLLLGGVWTLFAGMAGQKELHGVWGQTMWLVVPLGYWLVSTAWRNRIPAAFQTAYLGIGGTVAAVCCGVWVLYANITTPSQHFFYLPLLNPYELLMAAVFWQYARWTATPLFQGWHATTRRQAGAAALAVAFAAVSAGVMRVWHFYGGIEWRLHTLLESVGLQASLSVVWALAAIALMVSGNRKHIRSRWLIGAGLMGAVVVKLFLVELGSSGSIARIVSFTAVGLLLLLVGWFAPVPPKQEE